jgi:hypothetical protein
MAAPSTDFDVLYSQAIELFKAFPEYQFKTVTAMLVIIGWLISSETAQKFIRLHPDTALPWGIAAFSLLAVLKGVWVYGHYNRINLLHARLVQLAPSQSLSAESLAQLKIGKVLPLTYVLVNAMLCAAGSVVLWLVCH